MFINAFAVIAVAIASLLSFTTAHNATASVISSTEPIATQMPAVLGTVSSINGTSLMVSGKAGTSAPLTTYAVSTNGARILQQNATTSMASSLSTIKTGEQVTIVGTITGKAITAILIVIDLAPPNITTQNTSP